MGVKRIACKAGVVLLVVLGMFFSGPARVFVDFPSLLLVLGIGGLVWWNDADRKGRAFIDAGWLVFAIGLVAGMAQVAIEGSPSKMMASLSVSAIALVYGHLLGILIDM